MDTTNTAAITVRNSSASHKRGREMVAAMSHTGELKKTRIVSNSRGSARDTIDPAAARFDVVICTAQPRIEPAPHAVSGIAPQTAGVDGVAFDWDAVLGGLFKVRCAEGKHPPACAHVAVRHKGYWFYIDERDRDTKATFALLLELSRLQLSTDKGGSGPVLTLPIGGR